MRYSAHQELKALQMQQDAVIMQAKAILWQRKSAKVRLAALQRVEAAVAMTGSEELHEFLFKHGGATLMKAVTKAHEGDLKSSLEVVTEFMEGSERAVQEKDPAVAGKKASVGSNKWADFREVIPTIIGWEQLDVPKPRLVRGNDIQQLEAKVVKGDNGVCPIRGCNYAATLRTVDSHIREKHTKEVLVCPNGIHCRRKRGIQKTTNGDYMRRHFKDEGIKDPDVAARHAAQK